MNQQQQQHLQQLLQQQQQWTPQPQQQPQQQQQQQRGPPPPKPQYLPWGCANGNDLGPMGQSQFNSNNHQVPPSQFDAGSTLNGPPSATFMGYYNNDGSFKPSVSMQPYQLQQKLPSLSPDNRFCKKK